MSIKILSPLFKAGSILKYLDQFGRNASDNQKELRQIDLSSVDVYNKLYGLPTHHPLVAVIDLKNASLKNLSDRVPPCSSRNDSKTK